MIHLPKLRELGDKRMHRVYDKISGVIPRTWATQIVSSLDNLHGDLALDGRDGRCECLQSLSALRVCVRTNGDRP